MALLIAPLFTAGIALGGIQNANAGIGPVCIDPPPNLVSWWPLDETSGTLASDIADGNDGTHNGGPTPIAGKVDFALDFDGTNDLVDAGNPTNLKLTTGTIDAWIKTSDAGPGFRGIATKNMAYGMFLFSNTFGIFDWGTSTFKSTGINLADGQFHHVAFTFQSGVNGGTVLYIDGVAKLTTKMTVRNQNLSFNIGSDHNVPQNFAGIIDEVEVFDRVLTPTEIKEIFDADDAGKCKEGCSSGHWKNEARQNPNGGGDWTATGINPEVATLNSFFAGSFPPLKVKDTNKWPLFGSAADPKLIDALSAKGSNENALAREAAAAIANDANGAITYPLVLAQIVAIVDAALTAGTDPAFNAARDALFANNHLGEATLCPLPP